MDPLRGWAASGAMALTGDADGPPLAPWTTAASVVDEALAPWGLGSALLGERAARLGLSRRGRWSCGGASRLLEAADGWVAVSLARPEDGELVPALVAGEVDGEPWEAVASWARREAAEAVVERAARIGLAVGRIGESAAPFEARPAGGRRRATPPAVGPRVVDLSSLWAGPLCADLLRRAGAEVVKVESTGRPDGARRGDPGFYGLLNAGKASVAIDLTSERGRAALGELVAGADVVVSSARARAVEGLGLDPDDFLAAGSDKVWVAITGHGWATDRVGFGDDAAVAAGLVAWGEDGHPRFAGDAIADPVCGVMAGIAALDAWRAGGRWFVDASLAGAAARVVTGGSPARPGLPDGAGGWTVAGHRVAGPASRPPFGSGRPLGADTDVVLGAAR